MDAETRTAMNGSIEIWERRAKGEDISVGYRNCPLCMIFHGIPRRERGENVIGCDGCPVAERTGMRYCDKTPYVDFVDIPETETKARMAAAKREVEFLKSLVPE